MYLLDDEGRIIDAECSLGQMEGTQSIIVECHWGKNDKKGTKERNPDYNKLLECIFGRLAQLGTKITRVIVDSKRAATNFTIEGRTVKIDYPVDLTAVNIDKFRKALQNEVRKTARKKHTDSSGNGRKRIRIFLDSNINENQLIYGVSSMDTTDVIDNESLSFYETQRASSRKSRIGQDIFRQKLIKRFRGKCPVTGITEEHLLIASHIKPWEVCTNVERLDPHNGLLLSALADRLFDQGLVTFDENGNVMVSPCLSCEDQERCGIRDWSNPKLSDKSKRYMVYHRTSVFKSD